MAAYYVNPAYPYIGSSVFSIIILGWEAFENVSQLHPTLSIERKWYAGEAPVRCSFLGILDFRKGVDSVVNMTSDILVGLVFVCGVSYLMSLQN